MKSRIPFYRAETKTIPSAWIEHLLQEVDGKFYVIGNYREKVRNGKIIPTIDVWNEEVKNFNSFEIKKDTTSINFEDMIDSEGTKIFLDLDEVGAILSKSLL